MDKSAKMTRKNSKLKAANISKTRNVVNTIKHRDTSEPCSFTGLNTSNIGTNNMVTKDSNQLKCAEKAAKNITNFSLMLKKHSISTTYSSKFNKTSNNFVKKEVFRPVQYVSSYMNDKTKRQEKKSKQQSKEKLNKEIISEEIKTYIGPFDLSCCQEKSAKQIRESLIHALNNLKIKFTLKVI